MIINSNPKPGVHHFKNATLEIDTYGGNLQDKPAAFLIGRIRGHMDGKLVIKDDRSYRLDATYWLEPDKYDADLNTKRALKAELATQVLSYIGELFGHADYELHIEGKKSVRIEGKVK